MDDITLNSMTLLGAATLLLMALLTAALLLSARRIRELRVQLRRREASQGALERFNRIYEASPDAIGIIELPSERYIDVNPAWERLMGLRRAEVVGRVVSDFDVWGDAGERERYLRAFAEQGRVDAMPVSVRRRGGRLIRGLASARELVENGERCQLFIYRDLTQIEMLQRQADRAQAQVVAAAAANAAKTQFVSRMSHELRTPLNAVLGFAQLLRETAPLREDPTASERINAILHAGWHLLGLIEDVLDISQIESGRMRVEQQAVPLGEAVQRALELLRPQAEAAGVTLDGAGVEPGVESGVVLAGDERRLRQVLVNLLSNAIKYNRRGGSVTLGGRPGAAGRYLLSVSDTGVGMDESQLAHLFEPFNRLGRDRSGVEGVGIGLALSRSLVELMGGRIAVRSASGQGTTVELDLALQPNDQQAP